MAKLDGRPADWDLEILAANSALRRRDFAINPRARRSRYPIRALRYWIVLHLLAREVVRHGRPLRVLEIGVDRGQTLDFVRGVPPSLLGDLGDSVWDAISRSVDREALREVGYRHVVEADVSKDDLASDGDYDAVVVCHLLEHLYEPEAVLGRIATLVRDGGAIVGGVPAVPRWLEPLWERWLRRRARPWGHVSAFSSRRVRAMAARNGLAVELMTGTFLVRASGSPLEDSAAWARFNLLYGQLFSSYAGELYWALRREAPTPSSAEGRTGT